MVAVGNARAAREGIGNISWSVGMAETADLAPGSADLITAGAAFHWMQATVPLRDDADFPGRERKVRT